MKDLFHQTCTAVIGKKLPTNSRRTETKKLVVKLKWELQTKLSSSLPNTIPCVNLTSGKSKEIIF